MPTLVASARRTKVYDLVDSRRPTNLRSYYAEGPATLSYNKTTTATVSASVSSTATVEVDAVIAKASATYGVSLGSSWSKADTWTVSKTVPAGKTARLVLYRESRKIYAVKKRITQACKVYVIGKATINAPMKYGYLVWRLQYM